MATAKFTKAVTSGVCEELYECEWQIRNWELIQVDETLIKDQQFDISTGHQSSLLSKFTLGLEVSVADANGKRFVGIYCKLTELTGSKAEIPVSFSVSITNVKDGSFFWQPAPITKSMKVNDLCAHPNAVEFNLPSNPNADQILVDGSLKLDVKLRVLNPVSVPPTITSAVEEFQKLSAAKVCQDYGSMLKDDTSKMLSDLKIISRDKKEFLCHRAILSARNKYFADVIKTEMSGKDSGVHTIKDLSGKTVEVLLHYIYTGELLESWKHADVIVEFTDAAGKYKLTEVLDMLDKMLGGITDKTSATNLLLLGLAKKLKLQHAEKELMERIVKFTMKAQNSEELLALMKTEDGTTSTNNNGTRLTIPEAPQNNDSTTGIEQSVETKQIEEITSEIPTVNENVA